jgi:hypothetical protein
VLDAVQEDMNRTADMRNIYNILVGNSEWERPYVGGKYLNVSLNNTTILSILVKCK